MTADLLSRIIARLQSDSEYQPLYEALTVKCPHGLYDDKGYPVVLCAKCLGVGRYLCDWDALPDGAMAGPVMNAWADMGLAPSLVFDDDGRWALSCHSTQPAKPCPRHITVFIERCLWREGINAAVLAALADRLGIKEE